MLHKYPRDYRRINTKSDMYFSIAYQLLSANIDKLESLNLSDMLIIDDYSISLFKDYHIIIVFSTMAIESFVNDYLAVCFSDELYYDNFDKLNIMQKIEIMFSVIWEDSFDKSKSLYNFLHDLLKLRNTFVHSKSQKFDEKWLSKNSREIPIIDRTDGKSYEEAEVISSLNEIMGWIQNSYNAIRAFFLLCKAVDEHDENRHAVGLQLSCMASEDHFYINQMSEDANKKMKELESRINKLKKTLEIK